MYRRTLLRTAIPALAGLAVTAASASAAQVTVVPTPTEARTFATTNGGWSSSVDYGGLVCIPGVTCPTANPTYVAPNTSGSPGGSGGVGDGYLRDTFSTLLGVLATSTITWTSPTFDAPASVDTARLTMNIRPQIASLLQVGGVTLTPRLVGITNPAESVTLPGRALTAPSASFGQQAFDVPTANLVSGHQYRLAVGVSVTTNVSAVTTGNVDLDDVALTLGDLDLPDGLTATVPATGALRVTGSVDTAGSDTDVTVEYGPTTAYGSSTTPVTLSGGTAGAQDFSIPLTGLTPGATYHYRVRAQNADGPVTTADATFVAPSPPSDAVPTVSGDGNARGRTVTFDRASDVTSATVELVASDGTVTQSWPDTDDDGEVAITLPDADGDYAVRVRRTTTRGLVSVSDTVPVSLDRTGPDVSGVNASVTPALSTSRTRTVTLTRPSDATTVRAQVIDADDQPVGAAVTVTGGSADVQLGTADGEYRVRLTISDALGNDSVVTSTAVTLDTTAPTAGPAPTVGGTGADRTRTVTFTRDPSTTSATVELLDEDGIPIDTVPVPTGSSADVTLPDNDGTYAVRVVQKDAAGNDSTTDETPIVLDRVPPVSGPAPTTTGSNDAVVVNFTRAPDADQVEIEVRDASGNLVKTVTVPAGASTATFSLPPAAGRYAIRVVQIDAAGNRQPSADITVERTTPTTQPPTTTPPKSDPVQGDTARRTPTTPTTPVTPPTGTTPGTPPNPTVTCPRPAIVVTGVSRVGKRIRVTGFSSGAPGAKLSIRDGSGREAGTATIGAKGRFSAVVTGPGTTVRLRNVRYRAVLAGRTSSAAQLSRATTLTTVRRSGKTVTLQGRVDLRRIGKVRSISAVGGAGACPNPAGTLKTIGRVTVDRNGRYRLRVQVPAGGTLVVRTRVSGQRAAGRSLYVVR